jgi:hypothetical protein
MDRIHRPLRIIAALFLVALSAAPAAAQSFRRPPFPVAEPVSARVTITNQSDVTVAFRAHWGNERPQERVLDPGRAVTLETTFPAGTPRPELTVLFRNGPWLRRPEVLSLPSGHVDPRTDNPGRVYDFFTRRSNVGDIVTLQPR